MRGWVWLIILMVCWSPRLVASTGNPERLGDIVRIQQQVQRVLEPCLDATVGVGRGGSGVIVSEDGLVLTAAHVSVRPDRPVKITLRDGREVGAVSLGLNDLADAGMVKIIEEGPWPHVEVFRGMNRQAGAWCFALGHPGGLDLERGPVLRVGRLIGEHALVMRTDCHLIGGDSGGPLFNLAGEVIGIHSRVSEDIEDNYHAPIEAFLRHWQLFLEGEAIGDAERGEGRGGFLGVRSELSLNGALITEIVPGTPASQSSLKVGDVVTSVAGVRVYHPQELGWAVRRKTPGDIIQMGVIRREKPQVLNVQIGRRPQPKREEE